MSHVVDRLLPYVDGTLDADGRAAVEAHIATCARCARALATARLGHDAASSWAEGAAPSRELEHRLQSAIGVRPRRAAGLVAAGLAMLLSGAAGYALGDRTGETGVAQDTPLFALFFEEPVWPPAAPLQRTGYAEHANALRTADAWVGGEKLADDAGWRVLGDGSAVQPDDASFSGFFLVRATDYAQAIEIARASPHRRWGSVLVRQID